MSRESVKRDHLYRSTGGIDNLKLPSLPLVQVRGIMRAKLFDRLQSRHHGCLQTGRLYTLLIPDDGLAIREIEE
jgi:hypothetical protein